MFLLSAAVKNILPILSGALCKDGFQGIAKNIICDVLGIEDEEEEDIAKRLKDLTPEQLAELQKKEIELKKLMVTHEETLAEINAKDIAHAREVAGTDFASNQKLFGFMLFAFVMFLSISITVAAFFNIHGQLVKSIEFLLSQACTAFLMMYGYFFGGSMMARSNHITNNLESKKQNTKSMIGNMMHSVSSLVNKKKVKTI